MQFHPHTVQLRTTTALGPVRLSASPTGLSGLWFEGQRHEPTAGLYGQAGQPAWAEAPGHPLLQAVALQLGEYLSGERAQFDAALPLDLSGGTAFQQAVWRALYAMARGSTLSYGALSQQLGRPLAVRAVGAAVGRNPLSIIVPCHRVLGADGSLTGYAGGLDRKTALLTLEGALPSRAPSAKAPTRPARTAAPALRGARHVPA
jgi:methylated-DNA-[protein]-cysteine S-methyltransferase